MRMAILAAAAACAAVVLRRRIRAHRAAAAAAGVTPETRRADMIYIWTHVHGIPLPRAESMWESYERASAVARLGVKGK